MLRRFKRKTYDPVSYWNNRNNPNNASGTSTDRVQFDVEYIKNNLDLSKTAFELGPGVGRTFDAYNPEIALSTLDISQCYQERLDEIARRKNLVLKQYFLGQPLDPFPFSDNEFDVGISCQVFLHQPEDIFSHSLIEMMRICRKLIIISGLFEYKNDKKPKPDHVFYRNYIQEISNFNLYSNNTFIRDEILYFCVDLENQ